jgi:hypothetical protein
MEASMAAEAGGGEGQAESAEVQAPQVDLSPVLQQIEQVGGRLGQVEALMNQFAPQEEAEQRMSSAMEQQLSPLIQQIEQLRSQSDAQTLLKAFPEMADPKVAEAVVGGAQQAAVQMGVDPSLARRPGFIELVYKAQKFDQRAAGEVPVGDLNNPALEPGGGASPRGGLQDSANLAQEIVAARGGNSFWGA